MKAIKVLEYLGILILLGSCQKYSEINPNLPSGSAAIPPSMLLTTIENELANGPGTVDADQTSLFSSNFVALGNNSEVPCSPYNIWHWNQMLVSADLYYGGSNTYTWSNSFHPYEMLRNIIQMENLAYGLTDSKNNAYAAVAKFLRAYSFIWFSQRVGDIPMSQAGQPLTYPNPVYDSQHNVYKACLALLDTANTIINTIVADGGQAEDLAGLPFSGDIFGFNGLTGLQQWQKVINAYKLRVLISLSNKDGVGSASDLNIRGQFDAIVSNPKTYPLLGGESDNMVFAYNAAYNPYPNTVGTNTPNVEHVYLCSTLTSLLDSTQDPRAYVFCSPSGVELDSLNKEGAGANDFRTYVGASIDSSIAYLGKYFVSNPTVFSSVNFLRYYGSSTGPLTGDEAKGSIIIGYPEMCFNIAEGIERGWTTSGGTAKSWFDNGISASMSYYGIIDGATQKIGNVTGGTIDLHNGVNDSTVTYHLTNFMTNIDNSFTSANASGQIGLILNQKFIAFFFNSGWEAYYNWRRTTFPSTFISNGSAAINPSGKVPYRWEYPVSEQVYNTANLQKALSNQNFSSDATSYKLWINNPNL